jgi:hypothetical protein
MKGDSMGVTVQMDTVLYKALKKSQPEKRVEKDLLPEANAPLNKRSMRILFWSLYIHTEKHTQLQQKH